ncbi:MAG: GDSL-type esterase/lipase family protein [Paludibacter sp.]|nr:GDSL-type esterase/lipase family protein [Paludibacter sp.]
MLKKYLFCLTLILFIFNNINAKTFVSENGQLRVAGAQLVNKAGNPIRLCGISLGSLVFYNKDVVKWLQNDWKINVIRTQMSGNLDSIGDMSQLYYSKKQVENVIDVAIKQGIYVIVSFNGKDIYTAEAVNFFDEISKKYFKYPNIIYEISIQSNPQSTNVKQYFQTVVAAIRTNDKNNVIIAADKLFLNDIHIDDNNFIAAQKDLISGISGVISDSNDSNSMLLPRASSKGKWEISDLSDAGVKMREYLREFDNPKKAVSQTVITQTSTSKSDGALITMGRTETLPNGNVILISAASMVEFSFPQKENFDIQLKSLNSKYAYVSIEVDGNYAGRKRIDAQTTISLTFADAAQGHNIKIFKATEATTGDIELVIPKNLQLVRKDAAASSNKKIEFIGNSITSGMGNDLEIHCNKNDQWYDQHNAYFSYATMLAKELNLDFQLSSVSGIGMYRNWNDEHQSEAIMPDVYQNLYLNTNKTKPYKFEFKPDIISICLGTNDLSDGDGQKVRLPFNPEKFVSNYVNFIKMLYIHNPNAQIVLLDSPMITGNKRVVLNQCLDKIKAAFIADKTHKEILIFHFSDKIIPNGCGYHPDIENDTQMKDEMLDFFRKLVIEATLTDRADDKTKESKNKITNK